VEVLKVEDLFADLPVLETERFVLRKIALSDANDVFDYARDSEVSRYVLWETHRNPGDTFTFLNSVIHDQNNSRVTNWALVYKPEGRVVGTAGYLWWQPEHRKAEIGYTLARRLWGQGLMTEAVREIINFGFKTMELNRIEAHCIDGNRPSARVMERCGMKLEGLMREYIWRKGLPQNFRVYSILRSEWEKN